MKSKSDASCLLRLLGDLCARIKHAKQGTANIVVYKTKHMGGKVLAARGCYYHAPILVCKKVDPSLLRFLNYRQRSDICDIS